MKNNQLSSFPRVDARTLLASGLDPFDNSDAFFTSGLFSDGSPMSDLELDQLTDHQDGQKLLQEMACNPW